MKADVRRKLEMAVRVRDFCKAHPSDDPSYATMLTRLEERIDRADTLATQQRSGRIAEIWAAGRREELRRDMHFQLLRHLVRVGELAAKDKPELGGKFRLRTPNATHKSFLVAAKAMLAEGQANKDLFVSLGLSQTMLEELGKAVTQFEEATQIGNSGRSDHIGARADLETVATELLEVVELLNTFNRFRFKDDADLSAAWESARNVIGPVRTKPAQPSQKPEVPPASGIAPAA